MKKTKASTDSDPGPRLEGVNQYLEKNFPDFFAEARFQVGDDDYFLYARFGQYLARTIEQNRATREKINRGFTVLNKMARVSARHPRIRQMLVSGPLEYIVDAPKARALALKRLSPVAQGYMESLCESGVRRRAGTQRRARPFVRRSALAQDSGLRRALCALTSGIGSQRPSGCPQVGSRGVSVTFKLRVRRTTSSSSAEPTGHRLR